MNALQYLQWQTGGGGQGGVPIPSGANNSPYVLGVQPEAAVTPGYTFPQYNPYLLSPNPFAPGAAPTAAAGGGADGGAESIADILRQIFAPRQQSSFLGLPMDVWSMLLGLGGDLFSGFQQAGMNKDQLELQRQALAQNQKQFEANMGQRQGENAFEAGRTDPFTQQRSRQRQALMNALLSGYSPARLEGNRFTGGISGANPASAMSFFGPEAMTAAENAFTANARQAAPNYTHPNLANVGYSGAGSRLASSLTGQQAPGGTTGQGINEKDINADLMEYLRRTRGQQG